MSKPIHYKPGWTYLGVNRLQNLSPELQEKLRNKGDKVTIKKETYYLLYENKGWTIGGGTNKRPLINWWRRFKRIHLTGGNEE